MALKSHRWELIFFWFFAFTTNIIWTGTKLFASFSCGKTSWGVASTDNWVVYYRQGDQDQCPRYRTGYRYLEDMSYGIFAIDLFLHNTILVYTDRSENVQDTLVHWFKPIYNKSHDNLLPSRSAFLRGPTPVLWLLGFANITYVEHYAVQGACI